MGGIQDDPACTMEEHLALSKTQPGRQLLYQQMAHLKAARVLAGEATRLLEALAQHPPHACQKLQPANGELPQQHQQQQQQQHMLAKNAAASDIFPPRCCTASAGGPSGTVSATLSVVRLLRNMCALGQTCSEELCEEGVCSSLCTVASWAASSAACAEHGDAAKLLLLACAQLMANLAAGSEVCAQQLWQAAFPGVFALLVDEGRGARVVLVQNMYPFLYYCSTYIFYFPVLVEYPHPFLLWWSTGIPSFLLCSSCIHFFLQLRCFPCKHPYHTFFWRES